MAQAGVVRIRREYQLTIRQLAERMGESMQAVVEKAIDELKRKQFFEELDAAFGALKSNSAAWEEELAERNLWANTLQDDLDQDEVYTADGRLVAGG
jgi:hypothetical protein